VRLADMALGSDGSVIIGGTFESIDGFAVTNLARLKPDLTLDTNFFARDLILPPVTSLAVLPDGRVLIAGSFTNIGTNQFEGMVRLTAEGRLDTTFNAPFTTVPSSFALAETGNIVALAPWQMWKLNEDGSSAAGFGFFAATGTLHVVGSEVWAGGQRYFERRPLDSLYPDIFLQLEPFGSSSTAVAAIASSADGQTVFGGTFSTVKFAYDYRRTFWTQGLARVRMNPTPNDSLDLTFSAEFGPFDTSRRSKVATIQILPNRDILAGGFFETVNKIPQTNLALLRWDGSLREEFRPRLRGGSIDELLMLPAGGILVRGSVTNVDGKAVGPLFKLSYPAPRPPLVEFLAPRNADAFFAEEGGSQILAEVQGFDPDGALKEVVVFLNGTAVATNRWSRFSVSATPGLGEHWLTAVAEDQDGMRATNSVRFSILAERPSLIARRSEAGDWEIAFKGGALQESEDLRQWEVIAKSETPWRIPPGTIKRFYRVRAVSP
jgi:hypothetical protein